MLNTGLTCFTTAKELCSFGSLLAQRNTTTSCPVFLSSLHKHETQKAIKFDLRETIIKNFLKRNLEYTKKNPTFKIEVPHRSLFLIIH